MYSVLTSVTADDPVLLGLNYEKRRILIYGLFEKNKLASFSEVTKAKTC